MKKVLIPVLFLAIAGVFAAFTGSEKTAVEAEEVKWYTWEEAIEASKENPKKIFIDVYTDWCGWCKRMDANTFSKAEVAKYLNENFYPVKFDAEQKEPIEFDGHTFEFVKSGRRGVHTLAYSLLDGKLGYPAVVYLDEEMRRITVSPGYREADQMMNELRFIGEEHYKNSTYEEFLKSSK